MEEELHTLEERETRIETLESEYESCTEEIEALRNRKGELKSRARRAFDDAMQEILDRFDTGFESARLTPEFDLVVARDGRDASLDALSDGELELLGFIAALAGYESFGVDETVPILLIDGVGSLADENLHTLINYLDERCEYLVFTAYPEHEPFEGREINPTDWVVAHR
jgi:DNA repair exonuclease SbcCD ATPase subunit